MLCASLSFASAGVLLDQITWGVVVTVAFSDPSQRLFELVAPSESTQMTRRIRRESPTLGTAWFLGRRARCGALFPVHGHALALGSLGDPLRRGRARDARPRRLDQPLVGAGRLVLEQARPRHVDASDRDGDAWRSLPARQDADWNGHEPDHASGVGRPRARRAHHDPRHVSPLQGRGQDVRATRGAPRQRCARDDARLVHDRPPDDDGHAVRRGADRCMGLVLMGLHTPHDATVRVYEVRSGRDVCALRAGISCSARCSCVRFLRSSISVSRNCELVWNAGGATDSGGTGTSSGAGRAAATADFPETRTAARRFRLRSHTRREEPRVVRPDGVAYDGAVEPGVQAHLDRTCDMASRDELG